MVTVGGSWPMLRVITITSSCVFLDSGDTHLVHQRSISKLLGWPSRFLGLPAQAVRNAFERDRRVRQQKKGFPSWRGWSKTVISWPESIKGRLTLAPISTTPTDAYTLISLKKRLTDSLQFDALRNVDINAFLVKLYHVKRDTPL